MRKKGIHRSRKSACATLALRVFHPNSERLIAIYPTRLHGRLFDLNLRLRGDPASPANLWSVAGKPAIRTCVLRNLMPIKIPLKVTVGTRVRKT